MTPSPHDSGPLKLVTGPTFSSCDLRDDQSRMNSIPYGPSGGSNGCLSIKFPPARAPVWYQHSRIDQYAGTFSDCNRIDLYLIACCVPLQIAIYIDCSLYVFQTFDTTVYSPFIDLKRSIMPVNTTNKIPPPGPNLSTLGRKPL